MGSSSVELVAVKSLSVSEDHSPLQFNAAHTENSNMRGCVLKRFGDVVAHLLLPGNTGEMSGLIWGFGRFRADHKVREDNKTTTMADADRDNC